MDDPPLALDMRLRAKIDLLLDRLEAVVEQRDAAIRRGEELALALQRERRRVADVKRSRDAWKERDMDARRELDVWRERAQAFAAAIDAVREEVDT